MLVGAGRVEKRSLALVKDYRVGGVGSGLSSGFIERREKEEERIPRERLRNGQKGRREPGSPEERVF